MRWYEVSALRDDNNTWLLTLPSFPEIGSFGASQTKAWNNALKALQVAIAARIDVDEDFPVARHGKPDGTPYIEVPALTLIKSTLYLAMRRQNVTLPELARRMSLQEDRVARLLRIEHNSQLDLLERALAHVGVRMTIDFDTSGG